jgi:mannosyl-3-phosphoglycerate phosphatase family protein
MTEHTAILVFSDADRVLTHAAAASLAEAAGVLRQLDEDDVPLVLCSSKTRAEIEYIQQGLGLRQPFVSEAGGAVFIPAGYFPFDVPGARRIAGYDAVEFGRPSLDVIAALRRIAARERVSAVGFSDMSVEEVARACGLPLLQARLAKLREYSECFRIAEPDDLARRRLLKALEAARLRCVTGEPFDQVAAGADSVLAVAMLRAFYMRARGDLITVGADARRNAGDDDVVGWAERVVDAVRDTRSHLAATQIPSQGDSSPAGPSLA